MKDTELRGIVLQKFYDKRQDGNYFPKEKDFDLPIEMKNIVRICEQLNSQHLLDANIKWFKDGSNSGMVFGKISAYGVDVIEGSAKSPIGINFVQNHTVNISGSSNVVVGDHNQQNVTHHAEGLVRAIDTSSGTPAEKAEAKSRLKSFLEHPLLVAVAGGALALLA